MATTMTLRNHGHRDAASNFVKDASKNKRNLILGKKITATTRVPVSKTHRTDGRPHLVEISNQTTKIPVLAASKKMTVLSNQNSKDQHVTNSRPVVLQTTTRPTEMAPEAANKITHRGVTGKPCPTEKTTATATSRADKLGNQKHKCPPPETEKEQQLPILVVEDDEEDPQLCSEYVQDIYRNLLEIEAESCYAVMPSFLEHQPEVQGWQRGVLVDWLVLVQVKFRLLQETLLLAVDILDRYLQVAVVTKKNLQLVGVVAMLLAAKYEEIYPPQVSDFAYITADAYTTREIRDMERQILRGLEYRLNKPASIHFLRRYSKISEADTRDHALAKYILELSLLKPTLSCVLPSKKAAGALLLAKSILHPSKAATQSWTPTLAYYSGYSEDDIMPIKNQLQSALKEGHASKKHDAIRTKFASARLHKISSLEALDEL